MASLNLGHRDPGEGCVWQAKCEAWRCRSHGCPLSTSRNDLAVNRGGGTARFLAALCLEIMRSN